MIKQRTAKVIVAGLVGIVSACAGQPRSAEPAVTQVLFVCEHGNVKSLMAASYFNELAQRRGLPFKGISRGTSPDSTAVPNSIAARLGAEGFEVRDFRPVGVSSGDVAASARVITIGTELPATVDGAASEIEQWNDVPPASSDYASARDSLKAHVSKLVDQLARDSPR